MKLVIDRSEWLPAEVQKRTLTDPYLRDEYNFPSRPRYCCLGLYLRALGVPDEELEANGLPSAVDSYPEEAVWLQKKSEGSPGSERLREMDLSHLNDTSDLPLAERERRIAEEFAKNGVEVVFTGELYGSG